MKSNFALSLLILGALLLGACNYDTALTARPTKEIDSRLLGDWVAIDKETGKTESMQVRKLDKSTYVIAYDGDVYRAFHSDFAGMPFLSVQDLNASNRLYLFVTTSLSGDGRQVTLRTLNTKVVPETTKGHSALQKLIKANLTNPALLGDPLVFERPATP